MDEELKRLIQCLGVDAVKIITGAEDSTIRSWVFRGRISASAAAEIADSKYGKKHNFTRGSLRPDIKNWYK